MYCRYDYNAGATAANIMADIVAILTGTSTDSSTLSASCNKVNTTFINTVAPGWAVWDASAGSNAQVLRAPFADASGYKYTWFNFTATTYAIGLYESWNAGTHVGTNAATGSTTTGTAGYSPTAGGTIFVFAAASYVHFLCFTGSTYGQFISVMERTRSSLWDTAAVGVPPVGLAGAGTNSWSSTNSSLFTAPRSKSALFADVTGGSASLNLVSLWGQVSNSTASTPAYSLNNPTKTPDAAGTPQHTTTDVYAQNSARGDMGGQLYGVKHISTGGNTSDDVTVSGNTWFYVASAQAGFGVSPCICFPKF